MKSETIQALLAQGMTHEDIIDSIEDKLTEAADNHHKLAEKYDSLADKYLNMQEKALNIEGKLAKTNEKLEKAKDLFESIICLCTEGPEVMHKLELLTKILSEAKEGYKIMKEIGE